MSPDADMQEVTMKNGETSQVHVDGDAPLDDGYRHWQRIRVVCGHINRALNLMNDEAK